MSEGAGPVPATPTPAPCAAGPGLDGRHPTASVDRRSVASATDAQRPPAADDSRRRIAHAQRVAELLGRARAARLPAAPAR